LFSKSEVHVGLQKKVGLHSIISHISMNPYFYLWNRFPCLPWFSISRYDWGLGTSLRITFQRSFNR